jgi:DNA polymerase-4
MTGLGPGATGGCFLYVDCDRFFFAVEAAERPGLASDPRPVIIGRDPRQFPRGIVTTANDVARALGIQSGMSAAAALTRAPTAVFLPPRHALYERYSERVLAVIRQASPLVEQRSIDEAVCVWDAFEPTRALDLRQRILAVTGISVSMGLAASPLVAKMASEAAKRLPDHLCIVPPGGEAAWLAPQPVRALVGVGPKTEARLRALGIATIGDLAQRSRAALVVEFGQSYGGYLYEASRGIDDSELEPERAAKSVSSEHTFAADTTSREVLWREVRRQAEEVAGRLRELGVRAAEVAIKLRYADWRTITRQRHLPTATDDPGELALAAAALVRRHWDRARPIRLIGLRAGRFCGGAGPEQLPLAFTEADERAAPTAQLATVLPGAAAQPHPDTGAAQSMDGPTFAGFRPGLDAGGG